MASKREYKKSTRFSTYCNYQKEDLDVLIDKIKLTGIIPSGKYVSPSQIEPYLKDLYFKAVGCRNDGTSCKQDIDNTTMEFINLSQPVQLSLIKRFQVGESFDELQSLVLLKIMEILNNNTYDPTKSSLTSQIYENVYWVLLKNFKDEKEHEKRWISLINLDQKMNATE